MSALLAGQSVSSVAREYKIPKGTVSSWKQKAFDTARGVVPKSTQKSERIGELLLEYLAQNIETLKVQAAAFSDTAWLHKQNAADAAVLHGVLTDKAVRLLEALSNAASD